MSTAPGPVERALARVAAERDVTVLAARDVGSRAWNLAGPDADYDVGLLFAQAPVEYVKLDAYVESVHGGFDGADVRGWNVRRFAELLVESNPAVLEFLGSPLPYRDEVGLGEIAAYATGNFVPAGLYHHYRSLAESQYGTHVRDGRDATVSRNLHVARAVLYARYVRDAHAFPDLDFPAFLAAEGDRFDAALVERVGDLVRRKKGGAGGAVVGDVLGPEAVALPADLDPDEHAVRGIERERVNAFVERAMARVAP